VAHCAKPSPVEGRYDDSSMNLKPAILGVFDALANNYATQVSSAIQVDHRQVSGEVREVRS
jgi:hypothetical protein